MAWQPGAPIDDTNRGKYFFEIADAAGGRTLYSRGFSSIYGEWETTAEAKTMNRTFSESVRFPSVERPFDVVIRSAMIATLFARSGRSRIDPVGQVRRSEGCERMQAALMRIRNAGDPGDKLDLLILGDGYTAAERAKFQRDARRLVDALLKTSPFTERQNDINVWGLVPAAAESGISRPSQGIHRRSPIGATYDAFDSERYILTFENRAFRDIAANAPYDVVEILTNSATYGGGGIFGLYGTVAADSAWAPYVFVHEFGHHFAALADEYYTSDVAYLPAANRIEPWEPNVTALVDPSALKWRELVTPGTPLPTPWPKDEFEGYMRTTQEERREDPSDEPSGNRDGRALPTRDDAQHRAARAGDPTRASSAPSRAQITKRAATIGLRPIASCSRGTR